MSVCVCVLLYVIHFLHPVWMIHGIWVYADSNNSHPHCVANFYSGSALLAVQPLYMLRPCLSVCLSSVTFRSFVETNEATIMQFSLSGSKIILVSGEVKIVGKFAGDHP